VFSHLAVRMRPRSMIPCVPRVLVLEEVRMSRLGSFPVYAMACER